MDSAKPRMTVSDHSRVVDTFHGVEILIKMICVRCSCSGTGSQPESVSNTCATGISTSMNPIMRTIATTVKRG
ncbi:hypothetical protein BLOT_009060 [Blomia tropicalis]|nr:hypothetical protein BLOT_009060 [Blomia tropicalis]